MKKLLFLIVVLTLSLCHARLDTFAQGTAPVDSDADGKLEISSKANLLYLSQNPAANWAASYEQIQDISFVPADFASGGAFYNGGAGFSPIGSIAPYFTGTYDGSGYTISGLTINRPSTPNVGFFAVTSGATIKNIGLKNVNISGLGNTGGLVGYNSGSTVTNSNSSGTVSGNNSVGGLIGYNPYSAVSNSYSTGSVSGYSDVGGLIGYNAPFAVVSNSYSTGNVTGGNADIGGLVGYNYYGSTVSNSYSTGSVSGYQSVGGLVGCNDYSSTVSYCYSSSKVSAGSTWGGLVGYNASSVITASFWDTDIYGVTTAQMKQQTTFTNAGWDFVGETTNGTNNYWNIDGLTNSGYPFLSWQVVTQYTGPSNGGNTDHLQLFVTEGFGTGPTIKFFGNPPAAGALPGGINNVSLYRWVVTAGGFSFTSATMLVPIADLAGVTDPNTLVWLKRTTPGSGAWTNIGGHINGGYLESNPFTGFSEFAIGTSGTDNPLPVELSAFTGASTTAGVKLSWTTQSETDNAGFVLLRNDQKIATYMDTEALKGQGTKTGSSIYTYIDAEAELGLTYTYKLRSIDLSGQNHNYTQTVSVNVMEAVAGKTYTYGLDQNYPNPFNPTTTIRYQMKDAGLAKLAVYDVLGREVVSRVLQSGKGWNEYNFNAAKLGSGVYFYRLSVGGKFDKTMKMMLMK
ncbi:MAG: T9SS type A sorting domain-containing protein [Chlorobiales bacterium]|nr:T9SS type A sorting domain-containing protein [Chlorobiales bacterium]